MTPYVVSPATATGTTTSRSTSFTKGSHRMRALLLSVYGSRRTCTPSLSLGSLRFQIESHTLRVRDPGAPLSPLNDITYGCPA